jgi:hypothetical protein
MTNINNELFRPNCFDSESLYNGFREIFADAVMQEEVDRVNPDIENGNIDDVVELAAPHMMRDFSTDKIRVLQFVALIDERRMWQGSGVNHE